MLLRDIRMILRGLRNGAMPLIAAAALLGVGVTAALLTFGLVDTLLWRHVSQTHGDALRRVVAVDRQGRETTRYSFPELERIRDHVGDAGELASVYLQPVVLRANGIDTQTMAEIVDGRYFALTGTTAAVGRTLLATDDRPDTAPVAVLAEPFWRRHFNASPAVLGRTVQLNGSAFTVVGVANARGSNSFLGASVDAWVTIAHADPLVNPGWRTNVRERWFTTFVLPHGDVASVNVRLGHADEALAEAFPDPWRDRRLQTADATVVSGSQRSAATTLAVVLGGLAGLILLAAAANVSGVLIARAAANQRAVAIHLSIGAGRAAVLRRHLLEGLLLGVGAGTAALALYSWLRVQLAEIAILPTLTLRLDLPFEWTHSLLAIVGGAVVGAALAVVPAAWSARIDVAHALRDGDGRSGHSTLAARMRRGLVAAQVALSLVLIVGAMLFIRTVSALTTVDVGFDRDRLVAMDFDLEPAVRTRADLPQLARDALTRTAGLPGVLSNAMSSRAPIDQSTPTLEVQRPGDDSSRIADVTMYLTTDGYFATVGVPITRGRAFSAAEVNAAADVAIVNDSLAARLWPAGDALDRPLFLPAEGKTLRVVGIARDSKYRTLTESHRPHFYRPTPPTLGLTLLARTRGDARDALRAMQQELNAVGPGLVGFFPRTLDDHLAVQLLPARAAANAATVLGVLALCLSAAALYALVAWFVVLRRREIGVRMALGASSRDVHRLVVSQAVAAAWPGIVAGVVLSLALGGVVRSTLFGVGPSDPIALGVGLGLLAVVVVVAGYLPSRAASRVDPAQALRQ